MLRHQYPELSDVDLFGKIIVGNNVNRWNSIILPNVTIGDNCIIGAGSVVTKSVPSNSVVAGCLARVIETIDEYKKKVSDRMLNTKHMDWKSKKKYLMEHKDIL